MEIIPLIFYCFSLVAIGSAVMVVVSNNPVRSALFLVLAFFASAGLWMIAHAEFLALVLILVYVGAVMTLFLFVVMMLNLETVKVKQQVTLYVPILLFIVGLLVFLMNVATGNDHFSSSHFLQNPVTPLNFSNTKALGAVLYTDYAYAFEVAGALLLVAIIAAVSLSHRGPRNCKSQNSREQISVRREDRVRLVKMQTDQNQ